MRLIITGAVVLALAACAGGTGGKVHIATVNGHPDPRQLAQKIGCTNYQAETQTTLFAASTGSCDYGNGGSVSIDTFTNTTAEQRYQQVADGIGKQGDLIYGARWAVQADNADEAAAIQQKIGGTIH